MWFLPPLAGSLSAAFGVCGNEFAADGHVVHAEYGCGAHSDTELPTGAGSPQFEPYDDAALDVVASPVAPVEPAAVAETADSVETVDTTDTVETTGEAPEESGAAEVVADDEADTIADDASNTTDLAAQEEASASPS